LGGRERSRCRGAHSPASGPAVVQGDRRSRKTGCKLVIEHSLVSVSLLAATPSQQHDNTTNSPARELERWPLPLLTSCCVRTGRPNTTRALLPPRSRQRGHGAKSAPDCQLGLGTGRRRGSQPQSIARSQPRACSSQPIPRSCSTFPRSSSRPSKPQSPSPSLAELCCTPGARVAGA